MSKKKAITLLVVILALVVVFSILAVVPFQVGVMDYNPPLKNIPLGIELSGGVYVVYDVSVPLENGEPIYPESELHTNIQATIDRLQKRLLAAGYSEATVVESGTNRLRIEVADVGSGTIDSDEIFSIIGKPAVLEFRDPDGKVVVSGRHIKSAKAGYDKEYLVLLEFNDEGKKLFADATASLIGKNIDIYLDDEKIQSATVQTAITDGNAMISGSFTAESATALALQIQGGALTVDLTVTEQSNTSATLGENAITTSLLAGIIGLLLVFAFMIFVYKGLGIVADIALAIYTIIVIFLLGTLP
ncbi:MAG: protein translocase subunit SecDF, partial [Clostridia bacterium]